MESAKLEIVVHSGKDLKDVKHLSTMDPYVTVWIAGDGKESKKQATPIAEDGGCNPSWKCSMNFDIVSMNKDYILFFEIKHDGTMIDRNIGEVQVSFADLLAADAPGDKVSYQVTTPSGDKEGELIVSHKFSELVVSSDDDSDGSDNCSRKISGSPKKKKHGTVTKVVHKVAQTLILAGTEVATSCAVELFCD